VGAAPPIVYPALVSASFVAAQVTTSITPTTGTGDLGTTVTQAGNVYNITDGTRPGGGPNLFHSFGDFSVVAGDIGNFLNTPVNGSLPVTSNILSRVTGGNISNLYGTIQTTDFGNANLFLVNPSGIVFGPTGSVNVGGSVSFPTAQYLRLFDEVTGNSANFYADPANDGLANSVFAVSPVVDFGFLSPAAYGFLTSPDPSATITVQGSALAVPLGQSISLVGGKVVIQGAQLPDGTVQSAQLSAPAPTGTIQLASATSPGEFASFPWESLANATTLQAGPNNPVDPASATSFTSFGTVSIAPGSSIDVHGTSTVWVKGGQLVLSVNDATLNTSENSAQSNTMFLSPGSSIVTSNSGSDLGVEVQLIASNARMNGAFISTQTDGAERGGDVTLTADQVTLEQFSGIFTGAVGEGAAGHVTIQGTGAAGAADSVTLSGVSVVGSGTFGSGAGGKLSIMAQSLEASEFSTLNSSTNGSGTNGDIVMSVQQARLSSGAAFVSDTAFSGEGVVGGKITVQGLQGEGSKAASLILEGPGTGIKTQTFGTGRLGDIEVYAETVRMVDGAVIQAGTPLDTATAGTILIDAGVGVVDISDGSRILSQAFGFDAGPVTITADQLTLNNGSIVTNTSSPTGGRGGEVVLDVGSASLTNGSTINSSASNTGIAGNINILASGWVTMTTGSTITASSDGSGNAGDISINSKEVPGNTFEMQNSTINTSAALSDGGNIGIYAINMVRLTDSIITSSVGNETKIDTLGGNITIDPQFVILQNSQIRANAFAGAGGAIDIIATSAFIADPASIVNASSTLGVSGTVNIQSPLQNVGGELTALTQEFSSAAALLAQQCAARAADGKFSTFVVAAREGLPAEPGGFLASPSLTPEMFGSSLSGRGPHTRFAAAMGAFQEYDAKPIQMAKFGDACR